MTTRNKRKSKKRESIKQQRSTALKRNSLYFSNRKLYYRIQAEEMKLNLKYQKQKHFKARVQISNIEIKKSQRKKVEKDFKAPAKRVRKQVAINYRSDEQPYFISIRAITINPDVSERGLLIAVREARSKLQGTGINLSNMDSHYTGYEQKEIPSSEDKILNDYRVHIEILIRKRVQQYII